jgi:putative ABC transport system permease protein
LIILYVDFELGFDKFHKNEKKIHRVVMRQPGNMVVGSSSDWWIVSPYILKPTWENEVPEIDQVCRTTERNFSFRHHDQYVDEDVLVVDPEFLEMFTFPLAKGAAAKVFNDPYSVVISLRLAKKYFGDDDATGKTLVTNEGRLFRVTGVLSEIPENSHLKFDVLISFNTLEALNGGTLLTDNWLNNGYRTYVTLHEHTDLHALDAKLRKYDIAGFNGQTWSFHLQPLKDIHFNRQIRGTGDKGSVFIFISVGVFILFISAFNYMNLYIAHYRSRTKNIGMRRISGATRGQLVLQFFSESFMLVFISFLISLFLVWAILPLFNNFVGERLQFHSLWNFWVTMCVIGVVILMAFISGIYPALYLSGLQIINGIKGGIEKFSARARLFRKVVIGIQFSISILLIIGTITVYRQLEYANTKSLGYEKDLIMYITLDGIWYKDVDGIWKNKTETLRQELLRNPNIIKVAASSGIPSRMGWSNIPVWEGQAEGEKPFFYRLNVDEEFLDLYGIDIVQGQKFEEGMSRNNDAFILNEAAVKALAFKHPVGSRFGFEDKLGTVVGVTRDFHFESLHKPVTPLGIGLTTADGFNYLSIKIRSENISRTVDYVQKTWARLANNTALKYGFLDEQLEQLYMKDQRLAESLNYFSAMALLISCLGIFGLTSFSIKEKTKEISIRKVVGAPIVHLLQILSKDIFVIIGVASVVGGAIGWYVAGKWLDNFAYKIDLGVDVVIISSLLILMTAILPIGLKLIRAVNTNPVDALRAD